MLAFIIGVALAGILAGHGLFCQTLSSSGGGISGRVTDESGSGISQAIVTCIREGFFARCFTDSNGSYYLSNLQPGQYQVYFYAPGFLDQWYHNRADQAQADQVTVADGQSVTEINAAFARLGTVSGRVTDVSGQGIPNVRVIFSQTGIASKEFITNAEGRYSTDGLWPGQYQIQFSAGSASEFISGWYNRKPDQNSADLIEVPIRETITGIDAVLDRYGVINGRVTDGEDKGVMDVSVSLQSDQSYSTSNEARTDSLGYYWITGILPGSCSVRFSPPYESILLNQWYRGKTTHIEADRIIVHANQILTQIDAHLTDGATVSGRVTDQQGNPLGQIMVNLVNIQSAFSDYIPAGMTSPLGEYIIRKIEPGDYKIEFNTYAFWSDSIEYLPTWYPGNESYDEAQVVTLVRGQSLTGIDVQLQKAGSISGRIMTQDSTGVGGVGVSVDPDPLGRGYTSISDSDGSYRVSGLSQGSFRLYFYASRAGNYCNMWYRDAFDSTTVEAITLGPAEDIAGKDVTIIQGSCIEGRVTDNLGWWVDDINIKAYNSNNELIAATGSGLDGQYRLCGLPPGEIRLYCNTDWVNQRSSVNLVSEWYHHQANFSTADPIRISGHSLSGVDIQLEQGGSVTGFVTDEIGHGVENVSVTLFTGDHIAGTFNSGDNVAAQTTTDQSGFFQIKGLLPGLYALFASSSSDVFISTWYDQQTDPDASTPIAVDRGCSTQVQVFLTPCGPPPAPHPVTPPSATTGTPYIVQLYCYTFGSCQLQEASTPTFQDAQTVGTTRPPYSIFPQATFTHQVRDTTVYYYRARSFQACSDQEYWSPWSAPIALVVTPGSWVIGDLNLDTKLTLSDVLALADDLAENQALGGLGDLDLNGRIDARDLVCLANRVAGRLHSE